jgi:DNA-binding PadR family transcriptional regulator
MSDNGDDIDYDGHRIDPRSQIIIQVLRDLGETTAGDLASEAGLDDTSQVHHRVREHLGLDAAGLVEQSGTEPRSGNQPDEIVYILTDDGRAFARAHEADLVDAVAAAEAVDTLRRIRAVVDGFKHRVSDVENSVENQERWNNRWSTRVNRVEEDVSELENTVDDLSNNEFARGLNKLRMKAAGEYDTVHERLGGMDGRLDDLDTRIESTEQRLNEIESKLGEHVTEDELDDEIELAEVRVKSDIRREDEESGGLFRR